MKTQLFTSVALFVFVFGGGRLAHASFDLGDAADYAILFEGGGANQLSITNVTTNLAGSGAGQGGGIGHIGVGHTGTVHYDGGTINGRIDFSAANNNQYSYSSGAPPASVNYNVAAVASALNRVEALNSSLGAFNSATIGALYNVSVNGNTTINANAGSVHSNAANGFTNASIFNVTSFSLNNGQTLTLNGDGLHSIVLNFTMSTNFHGNVVLTGGLTPDDVLFNFVGGSNLLGGPTLDINNGGGSPSHPTWLTQGIFLNPNGAISVVNSNVLGRIFGGDTHNFQYVSGSNITAPMGVVPDAGMTATLFGIALVGIEGMRRAFRRGKT